MVKEGYVAKDAQEGLPEKKEHARKRVETIANTDTLPTPATNPTESLSLKFLVNSVQQFPA